MVLFKKINKPRIIILISIITVLAISCTDFFSSSWAPWAARDPNKLVPKVTTGNVDELILMAENNPDLSLAVLEKIGSAVKGASGKSKQKLQNAALSAATNAVGLGQAALGAANDIINIDLSNEDEAAEQAKKILLDAVDNMKNLDSTTQALLEILPDPNDSEAFDEWASGANADDLAMAAAILLAGEVKKADNIDDYLDTYHEDPSDSAALAIALASALDGREDELSGPLKSILQGLDLFKS